MPNGAWSVQSPAAVRDRRRDYRKPSEEQGETPVHRSTPDLIDTGADSTTIPVVHRCQHHEGGSVVRDFPEAR